MLHLIKRNVTPPGGFKDICPETKFPFVADNFSELVAKEKSHLIANNKTVPANLAEQIEDRLCRQMPKGICESDDGEKIVHGFGRSSVSHLVNATLAMNDRTPKVSRAIAESRAITCSACNRNVRSGGCHICKGITSAVNEMLGGRFTAHDGMLNVCDAVGMFCKVLVHNQDPQISKMRLDATPAKCWLRSNK